ncbi:nuclear transport factor 2 family protein [Samsonia erythrinae]|uniref:Ketosteroid isomerase-like protein n=1 Tax=Samsonia erythrinae TaxID=160434 RepID=A0A4R3VRZ3_9GAMM|nr:nuclear transport factor 2 family protein [Samsonia erythrinae]TCV07707.1 ketosteroid isomerase-like protein [Samsonia erythrinae]
MTPDYIAKTYLDALEKSDLNAILSLYDEQGIVHSPLYGPRKAADFYTVLFKDTGRAKINLKGVTKGEQVDGRPLITIWFKFKWTLPSGQPAHFECVDVLEMNEKGKIKALHIIYDTVTARPAYEAEYGPGSSWRPTFEDEE